MSVVHLTHQILLLATVMSTVHGGDITLKLKDSKKPITHLYLDFDHTLTVDGFSKIVVAIFCEGEAYPNCNCTRLPGGICNGTDQVSVNAMASALSTLPEGGRVNLTSSFGGEERVDSLRSWLERNRIALWEHALGHIYMVSTSWYPVTALQWQIYLKNVSDVLNLGFELEHIKTLADPGPGLSADKGAVIKANMEERHVDFESALFADDSGGNIRSAQDVCNTLYVFRRKGLDETDLEYIDTLVNGCCSWSSANQMTGGGVVLPFLTLIIVNVVTMSQ